MFTHTNVHRHGDYSGFVVVLVFLVSAAFRFR